MKRRPLQFPESIQGLLAGRYTRQKSHWLSGEGDWPLSLTLGSPSEADAAGNVEYVRSWIDAWQDWKGAGLLHWRECRWRNLGTQRLPNRLQLDTPEDVAHCLGEETRWRKARDRYARLSARWPLMAGRLKHHFNVLAEYADTDFERLESFLEWISQHPMSNLYPRQLPIAGFDSKWLESRQGLIKDLAASLRELDPAGVDFYQCCGLRRVPNLMRLRLLDPALCERMGGISDITAPIAEVAALNLPIQCAFIVENLQTGLAFGGLPGTVVLMGLGYGVDRLSEIKWLQDVAVGYWGDIDTHGFAILSRARAHLPRIRSLLMDEATLLAHRTLWVEEKQQHAADVLSNLTEAEHSLYHGLKQLQWGANVRLEQERISWAKAWGAVQAAHFTMGCP